jgi:hypothetical protein
MKGNKRNDGSKRSVRAPVPEQKSSAFPVIVAVILLAAGAGLYYALRPAPMESISTHPEAGLDPTPTSPVQPVSQPGAARPLDGNPLASPPAPVNPRPAPPPYIPPPADNRSSKDLVASLTQIDGKTPVGNEQAQVWKQALQSLVRQGASAIPDIQAYLAQNQNNDFSGINGTNVLGYPSLRAGLIDALAQIGGPEGTQALLQILQTSAIPSDVADLAKSMGPDATGQYQQQFLAAVRQQLFQAAQPQAAHADVGPLFQVLAAEGASGAQVAQDIQQYGAPWTFYSAITLAGLPQDAGLPGLAQMAQTPGNGQTIALDYLAQKSLNNPDALNALLDLARTGAANDFLLSTVAPFLAGRQYVLPSDAGQIPPGLSVQSIHMSSGNQNFLEYDASNPGQASAQIGVIDKLLQALPTSDLEAIQSLQQQRATLAAKLGK